MQIMSLTLMKSGKGFSSDLISYSFRMNDGIQRDICEEYIYDLFIYSNSCHILHISQSCGVIKIAFDARAIGRK